MIGDSRFRALEMKIGTTAAYAEPDPAVAEHVVIPPASP